VDKPYGPITALVLGGILLVGAGQMPKGVATPSVSSNLAGTTLFCVTEKSTPSVDETIAIREARAFCEANKFAGFLYLDDDDPAIQPIIVVGSTKNIQSPLLAAGKIENGKVIKLERIRKWDTGLSDILK
jgi:hypothetical protein